jgi:hypothetical protein
MQTPFRMLVSRDLLHAVTKLDKKPQHPERQLSEDDESGGEVAFKPYNK